MSHHELAATSPLTNQRSQYLVASAIITILLVHSGISAGVLAPLSINEAKDTYFPGGAFIYKGMLKDYAASFGTWRTIATDLKNGGIWNEEDAEDGDLLYTIFMDDESLIPGGKTRFASGTLLTSKQSSKDVDKIKKWLLETTNDGIDAKLMKKNIAEEDARHSKEVRYQVYQLPKVKVAMAYHPFNDGVWSAVLQSFKVMSTRCYYCSLLFELLEVGKSHVNVLFCSLHQRLYRNSRNTMPSMGKSQGINQVRSLLSTAASNKGCVLITW